MDCFYLRKPKNYVNGPIPIYLRITIDGNVKELSLNRRWEKIRWNPYASRPVGTKEDAKELCIYLDSLHVKVFQAKRQILEDGEQLTAGKLMGYVSGKQQRGKMLLKIFKEHNEKMKALVGKDYAAGTYTRFETALKHTRSSTVEPVIGTLVNYLALKRVNTRGIQQANKCMLMAAVAYNLKKLLKFKTYKASSIVKAMQIKAEKNLLMLLSDISFTIPIYNQK